jgi:hypothetical protein
MEPVAKNDCAGEGQQQFTGPGPGPNYARIMQNQNRTADCVIAQLPE